MKPCVRVVLVSPLWPISKVRSHASALVGWVVIAMDRQWVVYMAQWDTEDGPVKIGSTSDVKRRISDLQVASPYLVILARVIETDHEEIARWFERALHLELREFRMRGEWFRDEPEVWDIFAKYESHGFAAASAQDC